jgi:hypothetical protein
MYLGTSGTYSGKLGLGTTTPAAKLDVSGTIAVNRNYIYLAGGGDANHAITNISGSDGEQFRFYNFLDFVSTAGSGDDRILSNGYFGIGTTNPQAPLEVNGATSSTPMSSTSVNYSTITPSGGTSANHNGGLNGVNGAVAIIAHGDVIAQGTITVASTVSTSDRRIKDIRGLSNGAEDLATLNSIEITDYTMKDKFRWGNTPFKKVIAQQVEQVYPQAVTWEKDFLPNIYSFANKVEKTDRGYLMTLDKCLPASLNTGNIRLEVQSKGRVVANLVEAPGEDQLLLKTETDLTKGEVFVYGQEVSDFRTVDYDAISMLNVSATQELARRIKALEDENACLKEENRALNSAKADASELGQIKLQLEELKLLMQKNGIRSER